MGGISAGAGMAIAGGLGAAGSLASGMIGASGAQAAAQTNQAAQQQELALAQPYATAGQATENELLAELQSGALGQPAPTTTADISQMPGYQFTLQQGLLSTQNAAAAQGLGVSGAALMGASNYATGLAQSNYQNYFNDYWSNQMNRFNMLAGLTSTGESAAVGAGSNLGQSAAATGAAQQAAGTAAASGTSGATNSLTNALMLSSLNSQGSTISSGTPANDQAFLNQQPGGVLSV